MHMSFKETALSELKLDPFDQIGSKWALVAAGDEKSSNAMTVSWGFMGVMWGKNVFETVIRKSRYTYEFMEKSEYFTVSFYPEEYKKALSFFGSHSGRDCDKAKEGGLTPCMLDGVPAFEEAQTVLVCRKLYSQQMDISLLSDSEKHWYGDGDMHKAYIGEIVKVYTKE